MSAGKREDKAVGPGEIQPRKYAELSCKGCGLCLQQVLHLRHKVQAAMGSLEMIATSSV